MVHANFTLVQLKYFLASAEAGSMTAASRELLVSQSAISTAVAHLEKELGVQLVIRHHASGLTLTQAGRAFVREVRGFLAHADNLTELARGLGSALVGELSVGCFATFSPFYLPQLLAAYGKRHPQVEVSVLEDEHARLLTALHDGACEVAVLYRYDLGAAFDYEVLTRVPPYVLVAGNHRLAGRQRISLRELTDDPMVLLDLPHSREYFRRVLDSVGVEPTVERTSASYETVRAFVAHGHGWSLLNQRPLSGYTYDGSEVATIDLEDAVPPLDVVAAYPRGVRLTQRALAFNQCAHDLFNDT